MSTSSRVRKPSARVVESQAHSAASSAAVGRKRKAPAQPLPLLCAVTSAAQQDAAIQIQAMTPEQVRQVLAHHAQAQKVATAQALVKWQQRKTSAAAKQGGASAPMLAQKASATAAADAILAQETALPDDLEDEEIEAEQPPTKKTRRSTQLHVPDSDEEFEAAATSDIDQDDIINPDDVNLDEFLDNVLPESDADPAITVEEDDRNRIEIVDLTVTTPQKKAARGKSGKINQTTFSPQTRSLLNDTKLFSRAHTIAEEAYAAESSVGIIKDMYCAAERVTGVEAEMRQDALKCLQHSIPLFEAGITYASYSVTGARSKITGKAKDLLDPVFGVPGTLLRAGIIDRVAWLLQDMNYLYGGVDLTAKRVDRNQPFMGPIIKLLISQTIFGKGKANSEARRMIVHEQLIPGNTLAFVGAAIENALKSWSTGKNTEMVVGEDAGRESYLRHMADFAELQEKALRFTAQVQYKLLRSILNATNKSHLLDGVLVCTPGALAGVDFASLEVSAMDITDLENEEIE